MDELESEEIRLPPHGRGDAAGKEKTPPKQRFGRVCETIPQWLNDGGGAARAGRDRQGVLWRVRGRR